MINVDEEISLAYLLDPAFQLVNTAGKPLTDGWLEVYIHGTRNKYYCYKDWDKEFLHPFKIPLDSLGSNIVLASPAHAYDIYVYNKFGSLIMSRYNIVPVTGDGTIVKDVLVTGTDGSVKVDTTTSPNGVRYDLSVNTDIIATKESVDYAISSLRSKQDKLTAGSNISITNNIISATGIPTKTSELINDSEFISSSHKNKWYDITSYLGSMSSSNITDGRVSFYFNPFLMLTRFDMWVDCYSTSSINVFNFFDDIPSNNTLGIRDTIGRTNTGYACIARIKPTSGDFAKYVNISSSSNFIKADTFNSFGCPDDTIHDYLASKGFIEY